jgi:predicted ABC-type ATPase
MLERLHSLAEQQKSFAFETTLATRSYATWISQLKQQGYRFHLLYLWLRSPELALYRIRERVQLGGHDVPESLVRRRYVRGAQNFFRLYQPLADSWTVFDNSESDGPMLVAVGNTLTTTDIMQQELWDEIKGVADED